MPGGRIKAGPSTNALLNKKLLAGGLGGLGSWSDPYSLVAFCYNIAAMLRMLCATKSTSVFSWELELKYPINTKNMQGWCRD